MGGTEVPWWVALQEGLCPPLREPEHHEPGGTRAGWQHEAASRVERQFRTEVLLPQMSAQQWAMLRSQSGPVAGVPFSTAPSSPLTRIEPALFRVLLQRSQLSVCQTACSRSGVLGRGEFALESAAARVCREVGGRVATNILVRDLDLGTPDARDARRLEVVVDGLPLFGGAQLAVDTTLVSAIQGNGEPRNGAADRDGVALLSPKRNGRRLARTLSSSVQGLALGWWCWHWKRAVVGPRMRAQMCSCLHGHGPVGAPSGSTSSGAGMAIEIARLCRLEEELEVQVVPVPTTSEVLRYGESTPS